MGLTVEIDARDIDALLKNFSEFKDIVFVEMVSAMHASLAIFQEQVTGRTPVGVTGNLRQSIMPVTRGTTPQNFEGELATSLIYGLPVERGRRPGKFPPVDAIELWVQRKLGVSPDESRNVAYLIARKIAVSGTQGAFMFEKGFEAGKEPAIRIWQDVAEKASKRIDAEIERGR